MTILRGLRNAMIALVQTMGEIRGEAGIEMPAVLGFEPDKTKNV
jgi:hypothetical protein